MPSDSLVETPLVVQQPSEIRTAVQRLREDGARLGLVPTMGALHEGHLSLVDAAREECDRVAVSIFVNPTQFGEGEDFAAYPRDLAADVSRLSERGVDLVFAPQAADIYRPEHDTTVTVGDLAARFEGQFRPHHFPGVATIVLKLLQLMPAQVAFFGQKDYQQSLVVRRMVTDLNVPIEIRTCPTIREVDGLAKSSRNVYLSADERSQAAAIWQALQLAAREVTGGNTHSADIVAAMRGQLRAAGIDDIDYVALADAETLRPVPEIVGRTVALVAVRLGPTRLIDNHLLEPPASYWAP
ncbi:MAG: pantoate--beta-alanine ligase [Planctomycetota bacterium]|nr:MAG: pantoate--beta-alanine ligase [Planctomycetota bacterium]REK37884.1 MAG: pantoate--beta-alanine ligase [Planctomycetota bacterium]